MRKIIVSIMFFGLMAPGSTLADLINCDDGCTIITCDGWDCSVYHCEAGDCEKIGSYPDPNREKVEITPDAAGQGLSVYARPGVHNCSVVDECGVVTCSDDQCRVFVFDDGAMERIGKAGSKGEGEALYRLYQAETILDRLEQ